MPSANRIGVAFKPLEKAAVERVAKRENRTASAWLRIKAVQWLRELGELLEDDDAPEPAPAAPVTRPLILESGVRVSCHPPTLEEIEPWTQGGCRTARLPDGAVFFVAVPTPEGYGVWDAVKGEALSAPNRQIADYMIRKIYGPPPQLIRDVDPMWALLTEIGRGTDLAAQVAMFGSVEHLDLEHFPAEDQTQILWAARRAFGVDRARKMFPGTEVLG